jgi:phosphatidylglycerophosphate synthase
MYGRQELLAAAVFLLASLTDGLDGYLARRTHRVTTLGTLLSPLADQLLVATAYITLVRFAPELVSGWMAVLIVGREFLVTGLCSVAVQEGMPLRPRKTGKVKTVVQIISVLVDGGGRGDSGTGDCEWGDLADAGRVAAVGAVVLPRVLGGGDAEEPAAEGGGAIGFKVGRLEG